MSRQKNIPWLLVGILGLLAVAIGTYFWASRTISSLQAYRSPLADRPPAPGNELGQPMTRKVVIVLIDALRYDTSMDVSIMPFLNELRTQSAVAIMQSRPPSFSAPAFATLLTGSWPDLNDSQVFNPPDEFTARSFTQDDIYAAAHRSGLRTAVSGYSWYAQILDNSGVDAIFSTLGEDDAADRKVVDNALPWLDQDYQLILIHLDQVDYAGHHEGGPKSSNWNTAATRVDNLLREITNQLVLSKDTIIVVSDHGQIDIGGHGGTEAVTLVEPFVTAGAGILTGSIQNIQMVDIAPTVAVLLGTNIPASSQGRPLVEILDLSPEQVGSIEAEVKGQQIRLLDAYTKAIGHPATQIDKDDSIPTIQLAFEQARMRRLANERVWRNMLALFLILVPGTMLFLHRQRKTIWLLCGAIMYIALFNLGYIILENRTYSVSSIPGEMEFILYTTVPVSISLILAWLLPMLGLHAFRSGAKRAAEISLQAVWFTIFLLTIPILLNFAINGISPTWTLPNFGVLYFSFFAIVQCLFIAAIGLILTGLAAGIGRIAAKKP